MHEFRGRLQDLAAQKFHLAKLHQIRLEGRLKAVKAKRASDQAKASSANSKQWRPKGHRSQRRHQQGVEKSFLARSVHLLAAECCSNAWLWWRTLLCSALASCLALAGLLHLLCLHPSLGFPRLGWWFLARLACSFCFFFRDLVFQGLVVQIYLSMFYIAFPRLGCAIFWLLLCFFQDSVVQVLVYDSFPETWFSKFGLLIIFPKLGRPSCGLRCFSKTWFSKFWFVVFPRLGCPSFGCFPFFQNLVVQVVVYVVFPKLGSPSFGSLFFQDLVVQVLVVFLFSKTWLSKFWFVVFSKTWLSKFWLVSCFSQDLVVQVLVYVVFSKTWLSKFWLVVFPKTWLSKFWSMLFFPRLGCPSFGLRFCFPKLGCPSFGLCCFFPRLGCPSFGLCCVSKTWLSKSW